MNILSPFYGCEVTDDPSLPKMATVSQLSYKPYPIYRRRGVESDELSSATGYVNNATDTTVYYPFCCIHHVFNCGVCLQEQKRLGTTYRDSYIPYEGQRRPNRNHPDGAECLNHTQALNHTTTSKSAYVQYPEEYYCNGRFRAPAEQFDKIDLKGNSEYKTKYVEHPVVAPKIVHERVRPFKSPCFTATSTYRASYNN